MAGIGLVAASYGCTMGIQGIETGRQQSTAIFLAQQRLDHVKVASLIESAAPLEYVSAGAFQAEAYGAITGVLTYRRTVDLTTYIGPASGCRMASGHNSRHQRVLSADHCPRRLDHRARGPASPRP